MKVVPLTKGYCAFVDDDDFDRVSAYAWQARVKPNGKVYASRNFVTPMTGGKSTTVMLHRFILGSDSGVVIDHRDGDGLNNTKGNLRICTKAENTRYQGLNRRNKSGKKGVCWDSKTQKWRSYMAFNGKRFDIGYYTDIQAAADAYDAKAIELYGDFALTNKAIAAKA